jgi:hypothetical protein
LSGGQPRGEHDEVGRSGVLVSRRTATRRMGRSPLFKALEVPSTVSAVARSFIDSMIAEGAYPKEHFPSGPYPADKLTYKNPRMVEFTTPANKED